MDNGKIFQTVEKPRLSQEVARQIAQAIREGRFLPGEALPPERELAAKFSVSRPILREALSILQIQGFISIRHGRGTFVKDPATDILHVSIDQWLGNNRSLVEQFYEARIAIEPVCAALAAQRASDADVAVLQDILNREEQLVGDENVALMVSTDIDFHSTVAILSGNEFLIKMLDSLIVPETDIRKIVLRLPNHTDATHKDHLQILNAIARHDPEAARKAMINALSKPLEVVKEFMSKDGERKT